MSFLQATDQTVLEIIRTGEASGSLCRVVAQRASQYLRCWIWFPQAQCLCPGGHACANRPGLLTVIDASNRQHSTQIYHSTVNREK